MAIDLASAPAPRTSPGLGPSHAARREMMSMFGIEWLRNGMLVDKGSTALADEAAAVANARSRAAEVAARPEDC